MKTNFSVPQIADIAKKVRTYKKLYVTTRGQMFLKKVDAEEAVRTLNMILDDANDQVGILPVTDEMLSIEKLKVFGKSPTLFGKMFDEAVIPVSKPDKKKEHKRTVGAAKADSKEVVDSVEAALGLKDEPTPTPTPTQTPTTPPKTAK